MHRWSSNGKLLLTGEYLVLRGALALAVPLKLKQSLSVVNNSIKTLKWKAMIPQGVWFNAEFETGEFNIIETNNSLLSNKLKNILMSVRELSSGFMGDENGFDIVTDVDFNPAYGFGTSSTLIYNIAKWAQVDPYELLELTFGGSGYDIACAGSSSPLLFRRIDNDITVTNVTFNPVFKHNLYFVYLGNKQNSADSIKKFNKQAKVATNDIKRISEISQLIIDAGSIDEFERLITEHEMIMSSILDLPTVKSLKFDGIQGAVKSLGAWGGDFVLVTSDKPKDRFISEMQLIGFKTVFSYDDIVFT